MPIVDGSLSDWDEALRLDRPGTGVSGYKLYGLLEGGKYYFALQAPGAIADYTTLNFDVDRNTTTGDTSALGRESYAQVVAGALSFQKYTSGGYVYSAAGPAIYSSDRTVVEFSVDQSLLDSDGIDVLANINGAALPVDYALWTYSVLPIKQPTTIGNFTLDGVIAAGESSTSIGSTAAHKLSVADAGTHYVISVKAEDAIDAGSNITIDLDRGAATGLGKEFTFKLTPNLTGQLLQGSNLIAGDLAYGLSQDQKTMEIALDKAVIGSSAAIDIAFSQNYTPGAVVNGVFRAAPATADSDHRIAIVYSDTTAATYLGNSGEAALTLYSQLFMAAQHQAMMAGVPYDLLTEADLTNLDKIKAYDTLVFPSFSKVPSNHPAIVATLQQAADQYHVGFVTAGNFMTNDASGAALPGHPYATMESLLGVTRLATSPTGTVNIELKAAAGYPLEDGTLQAGETIRTYTSAATEYFGPTNGTGLSVVNQVVNGQANAAVITTETGGRNVHFATDAFLGNDNLLWDAIDWSSQGTHPAINLSMSRGESLVASRNDMDQSQETEDVNPSGTTDGIYDKLLPLLEQWKSKFNFVGSYYVNIGEGSQGQSTDWTVSKPYYDKIVALGNELGSHSLTHPENTNLLTDAQIAAEFGTVEAILAEHGIDIRGAAVPGAPETISTTREIIQYYDYLSGGYTGLGAGYPGAFGFLSPSEASKVYLAPNVKFDFSLVGFEQKTAEQADAAWAAAWADLTSHSSTPIVLWPWHDYGPTQWQVDAGVPSKYSLEMFTNFISRAYQNNAEFVTLADLADRIKAFEGSSLSYTVAGDVISATVGTSSGKFDLDLETMQIENVGVGSDGWYAFDKDSVFLTDAGRTFTIQTGEEPDDVTHLSKLSMRSELIAASGDGNNLTFTVDGEGRFEVLVAGTGEYAVTGATFVSRVNDLLTLDVGALGLHTVSVTPVTAPPANIPPVASGFMAAGVEDTTAPITGKVVATDANNDTLTYALLSGVSSNAGLLSFASDGSFSFVPAANFNGTASFSYKANDGRADSAPATVTIYVTPVNDAPVVATLAEHFAGNPANVPILGQLLAGFDVDGDPLTFSEVISSEVGGNVAINPDGKFTFIPAPNYIGTASFSYQVADAELSSSEKNVTLAIAPTTNPGGGGNSGGGGGGGNPQPGPGPSSEVKGTSGDDRFIDTAAAEHYVGLDGLDYVVLTGKRADYVLALGADHLPASIMGPGGDDTFSSVERLQFSDGVLAFDETASQVYRLYEAAFDRQPDIGGLTYWLNAFDEGQKDLVSTSLDFLYSPEFTSINGDFRTLDDTQVVETLYRNILDRGGEAEGIAFWVGELVNGLSREHLLTHFSESAENVAGTSDETDGGIWLQPDLVWV